MLEGSDQEYKRKAKLCAGGVYEGYGVEAFEKRSSEHLRFCKKEKVEKIIKIRKSGKRQEEGLAGSL